MSARARLVAQRSLISLFIFFASVVLLAALASAQEPGTWAQLATNMQQARAGHTATFLGEGKVLIVGGVDASGQVLATAELYDAETGLYTTLSSSLPTGVWGHSATLLDDGTVLIAGGTGASGQAVAAVQSFRPSTGVFSLVGPLNTPRAQHSATALSNGQVLIAGGTDGSNVLASFELFDPATKVTALATSTLLTSRKAHSATLLNDGRVLFVGGSDGSTALGSAELYDPDEGTIRVVGSLITAREWASAALLLDGKVVVAGGQDALRQDLNTVEIYNPRAKTFTQLLVGLSTPRSGHFGLTLPFSGKVLIVGGTNGNIPVAIAEVYDPMTDMIAAVNPPVEGRQFFAANFLDPPYSGILLATGGMGNTSIPLASSEAFFFPTLRSDRHDYQPGETVRLHGVGWLPHETVAITIKESSSDPSVTITVVADAEGSFMNDELQINSGDAGVKFLASAKGLTSQWTAQTTFTDAVTFFTETFNVTEDDNDVGAAGGVTGWVDGDGAGTNCSVENGGGDYLRLRNGCKVTKTNISTANYTNIRLQYTWGQNTDTSGSSNDGSDGSLVVQWKLSSLADLDANWTTVNTHSLNSDDEDAANANSVDVALGALAANTSIDIRFWGNTPEVADEAWVDNVLLRGDCLLYLFCEDFNVLSNDNNLAATLGVSGWTDLSDSDCAVRLFNGNGYLRLQDDCTAAKTNISTIGYTNIHLQYTWGEDEDSDGSLVVEWKRSSDSTWLPVNTHNLSDDDETPPNENSVDFPLPASAANTTIDIRFRADDIDDGEARVDNVFVTGTLAPVKALPVITFGAAPAPTYLGGNFTVSATTTNTDSSTLTYSRVSGPCALVSGATFSSSGAGTCVVRASGAETTNFLAATADQNVTIAKALPVITFGAAPAPTYLGGNFTVSATTTNTDSSALTYSRVSGPCALVSGATFSSSGAGTCVVRASGAETTNFLAATADQSVTIAKALPVITFGAAPTPTYGGGNFTVSATTTNTDSSTLTYSRVSGPCALVSGAEFSSSGAGTCVVRASGAETTNFLAATADQSVTINKAATSILYNNAFVAVIGNNVTLTATLSSSVTACKAGQTISFSLDDDPTTVDIDDGPYLLGTATTNSSGVATQTVPTTGWLDGAYTITASYSGSPNTNCANSSDDAGLTAAAPGDSATGGGWYTPNGRLNFGFTVRRIPNVTPVAYRGQILIHNNGKWRFKGSLNSYVLGTSGANAGVGTVGGTGNLYRWDSTANGGLGEWVLAAQGIGISASFKDLNQGGGKKNATQDMFGFQINYSFPGNNNPNSGLIELKGGNITVSINGV